MSVSLLISYFKMFLKVVIDQFKWNMLQTNTQLVYDQLNPSSKDWNKS